MSGCDWAKKSFSVAMSSGLSGEKILNCHLCKFNPYHSKDVDSKLADICDKCKDGSNFKTKRSKGKSIR